MANKQELVGVYAREKHRWPNADCDVIVAQLNDGTMIKGPAEVNELKPGLKYRFTGYEENRGHGDQFVFTSFTVERPFKEKEVVAYLQQVDGIGKKTAEALWDEYGSDSIEKIKDSHEECVGISKNFTKELANRASLFLKSWEKTEFSKLSLMGLLNGRGFPRRTVEKCIEKWGVSASELIKRNPYRLIEFRGCSFGNTDQMYVDLCSELPTHEERNKALGRLKRQALCMHHGITSDSNGHTWHDVQVSIRNLEKYMSGVRCDPKRAMKLAMRAKMITGRRDCEGCYGKKTDEYGNRCQVCKGTGGKAFITDRQKSMDEYSAAVSVVNSISNTLALDWPSIDTIQDIRDHQRVELAKALTTRFAILSGSPGTGKTFTVSRLTKALIDSHGAGQIALCAPTGKAAQRLNEMLSEHKIKNIKATTIHRLLGVCASKDGGYEFVHGPGNPMTYKFVICDEVSMVDVKLFGSLVAAMRSNGHLLMVGDQNQLSPIGHGCPLRDMIRCKLIGVGELTQIERNSGRIVKACKQIREQHTFTIPNKINLSTGENLAISECSTPEKQLEEISSIINKIKAAGKYDPIWDVQVLVAVNENSEVSRKILNEKLQGILNPDGEQIAGNPFRVDDKIINSKNNWYNVDDYGEGFDPDETNDKGQVFVANGEMGRVMSVYPKYTIIHLASRNIDIRVTHGGKKDAGDEGSCSDWEIAYAVSVHKSQGSEWPIGIVVIDSSTGANMVCSREWIYTAISRFKVACRLVGKATVAKSFCYKSSLNSRKTFLVERIHEIHTRKLTDSKALHNDISTTDVAS